MKTANPCPIKLNLRLHPYFRAGTLRWEGSALIGKTSGGTEVQIGFWGEWKQIENYLTAHPTPDTW